MQQFVLQYVQVASEKNMFKFIIFLWRNQIYACSIYYSIQRIKFDKIRRLNRVLHFCRAFDWPCRIIRQKCDTDSNVEFLRDWSKHVTWPNIHEQKLGNIRDYYVLKQWIPLKACANWLVKHRISFAIYLRANREKIASPFAPVKIEEIIQIKQLFTSVSLASSE